MKLSTMIHDEFVIVLTYVLNHLKNCSSCNRRDSVSCELVNIINIAYEVFKNVQICDITIDK